MDIISEILEIDKLAEDKIAQANTQKLEIEKETDNALTKIKEQADSKIADYRAQKEQETHNEILSSTELVEQDEKKQIDSINNVYNEKHSKWESDITARILNPVS